MKRESRAGKLLQSGIIFAAINFLTGLGNMAFQVVIGHYLTGKGQFSHANGAINALMPLLGLIPQAAIMAVTHYIAHFDAIGDAARLQGLLAGCRKFLFHLTIVGSVAAVIAIKPLSVFFHLDSTLMVAVTLTGALLGLWTSLVTALCQGLAWFKRLAFIAFIVMLLRLAFGFVAIPLWPSSETSVLASTFGLLAYLMMFFWKKDLSLPRGTVSTSPWNHEFVLYLAMSAAYVIGNYCFSLSDMLVMQRHFPESDAYAAAERFAISLPITVAPLLTVLFTNRSVEHTAGALRQQLKLIALFAAGLIFGAFCLYFARHLCLKLIGKDSPEAAEMIRPLATAMIFVGLLQAIGTWALASRWSKISLLYGGLGLGYSALILVAGKTSAELLSEMPIATGFAFLTLFVVWLAAMRRHKPVA